jgi:hypothetical protein
MSSIYRHFWHPSLEDDALEVCSKCGASKKVLAPDDSKCVGTVHGGIRMEPGPPAEPQRPMHESQAAAQQREPGGRLRPVSAP